MSFDTSAYFKGVVSTSKIIIFTVIPYFLLAELLLYLELMPVIAQVFEPFTSLLSLPPEAALALASGIFLNLYAAIAFAAPLDLSVYHWTILGLFLGVIHGIPVESAVMKKLGIDWLHSILFRLIMAFVVVMPLLLIPSELLFANPDLIQVSTYQVHTSAPDTWLDFVLTKSLEAISLSIQIILLIALVLLLTTWLKGLRVLSKFNHHLSTVMALITGVLIGITYGAGVLIKEAKFMSRKQVLSVCYFLMVAHALIEDTLLFVFFGADALLLITIRLLVGLIVFALIYLYYPKDEAPIQLPKS